MAPRRIGWFSVALVVVVSSCFAEPPLGGTSVARGGSGQLEEPGGEAAVPSTGGEPQVEGNQICHSPVLASEQLVARVNVISDEALPPEQEVFVSALFDEFKSQCGACHYDASFGDFQFNRENFWRKVDQTVLDRIKSDKPDEFMPPSNSGGIPWSSRKGDAVTHLVGQLEQWIAAGSKPDVYYVKNDTTDKPYVFTGELGTGLTNLGSCVPDTAFAFGSSVDSMDELDAMFEAAEQEPYVLGAGIPPEDQLGLPLLLQDTDLKTFDSATLARAGVVAFVPTYPLWTDGAGKLRHVRVPRGKSIHFNKETQKFEIPPNTRFYKTFFKDVIDRDGNARWRKMETRLIVARPDKIVDGQRVPQALFGTYQWDPEETRAELVTLPQRNDEPFKDLVVTYTPDEPRAQAIRDSLPPNITYELEYQGALRRYAIPGRERCVQCHMGSDEGTFVLGFTPLQIRRRETDEGGTYEPTPEDELSQLSRLIAYGVITGVENEDDIKLLEDSQGSRKPRNDLELKAQGYLLGNCSHCHNPNGFPTQVAPELGPLLDFFPDADGGVFQFPLERYSPRIRRGPDSAPLTYITPSLRDVFPVNWDAAVNDKSWTAKHTVSTVGMITKITFFDAPWRSLVWRNVQNAFPYAEDFTLYPHMPMNTAGYDCRAQRILGEWMVSIPAVRKRPELHEDYYPAGGLPPFPNDFPYNEINLTDRAPQPYVEVPPDAAGYAEAAKAAQKRLEAFRAGAQYQTCLMPRDIVDEEILRGTGRTDPLDTSMPPDGVPDQPHWVATDLTERAGPWQPRREQWEEFLITDEPDVTDVVIPLLRLPGTRLTNSGFEAFARAPFPMGRWKVAPGCDFSKEMKAGDFVGAARPRWLDVSKLAATEPVYRSTPGQAVFDMVCVNCHGPRADSKGRQADTVQLLSGGETRVANLRDGLFGPSGQVGKNLVDEFSGPATAEITARDWAARYMAWMALGGTQRIIPKTVLAQVARTEVAGTLREEALISPSDVNANMLESARAACKLVLPAGPRAPIVNPGGPLKYAIRTDTTALMEENGDAELWQQICSFNNEPVLRVVSVPTEGPAVYRLYKGQGYPAGATVGDQHGELVTGLDPKTNTFPWCVNGSFNPGKVAEWRAELNPPPPLCPDEFMSSASLLDPEYVTQWATRGAINAGFAVFIFLEEVTNGRLSPVRYNECQLLTAKP